MDVIIGFKMRVSRFASKLDRPANRSPMMRKEQQVFPEELVELSVERLGARGDGIAQYRSEPVFLPLTVPGDRVRARLGARRGGGREGRVVDRLASGPERTDPACQHFGVCGGCALQHLRATSYQAVKLGALRAALERVGIDPGVVQPLRVAPPARRPARVGLLRPGDPLLPARIGFRERFRHELVDITECPILEAPLFDAVTKLRQVAADLLPPGGTAEATLTRTDSGIDLLIEAAEQPALGALEMLAGFAEASDLARIVWRSSGTEIPVLERRPVRVLLSGIAVPVPPGAFLQASRAAEMILVEEVVSGIGPRRPALDLFAGLGTFAFALAHAGPVHAVEGEERAAAALASAAAEDHCRAARPLSRSRAARTALPLCRCSVRSAARRRRLRGRGAGRLHAPYSRCRLLQPRYLRA